MKNIETCLELVLYRGASQCEAECSVSAQGLVSEGLVEVGIGVFRAMGL